MRIIQITPGSGDNFYCENCLRDLSLVRAMHRAGQDILMVPLYLPLNLDAAPPAAQGPLFFGGINVYLQQKLDVFRKTPRWLDRWLDNPRLLGKIGKLSGMTSAKELGATTVSMLKGPQGRQLKELDRLIGWLKTLEPQPDVVVLSNILLSGMGPALKESLRVPLVCMLQDEEGFLDSLPEPYAKEGWDLVRQNAASFDALIAVSGYYRGIMAEKLPLSAQKIEYIRMGVDPAEYEPAQRPPETPVLGFLSRMSYEYGLDILADAVIKLRQNQRLKNLKLRIAGGKTSRDESYLRKIRRELSSQMGSDVIFYEKYDLVARREFLSGLSAVVVPLRKPQAYGMFALEACATGVPFVAPAIGVFPEMAEATRAGILYRTNTSACLAETLNPLLSQKNELFEMGQRGRKAILDVYSIDKTVKKMIELFSRLRSI